MLERQQGEEAIEAMRICLEGWQALQGGLENAADAVGLDFEKITSRDGTSFQSMLLRIDEIFSLIEGGGYQASNPAMVTLFDDELIPLMELAEEALLAGLRFLDKPLH